MARYAALSCTTYVALQAKLHVSKQSVSKHVRTLCIKKEVVLFKTASFFYLAVGATVNQFVPQK